MEEVYQSGCNCAGGPSKCECQPGYVCCSQKNNEGVFGLCIKKEKGCDVRTGFSKTKLPSTVLEGYLPDFPAERYTDASSDDPCKQWKTGFYILMIIVLIFFFMTICSMVKRPY